MRDPYLSVWDDPEEFPRDDPDDAPHPGDPAIAGTTGYTFDIAADDNRREPDRRQRRLQRINDHLSTREYRERRKHELREQNGGRFA